MNDTTRSVATCTSVALGLVFFVSSASAAVSSRSYVQSGLVAQYDGINNAGHDIAHSPDATTWTDLTGNGNDATKAANVAWTANGWVNGAAGKPMMVGTGLAAVTATKTFTAEFACTPSRRDTRECFFSQYNQRGVCIEHNSSSGNKTGGFLRLYVNGAPVRDWNAHDLKIQSNEWASVSLACTPSCQTFRKNGTDVRSTFFDLNSIGLLSSTCPSAIGGDPNRDSMAFYGTYNAFRLYDRALSEEEARLNAAIDAVRFNGADWSDYPEFECYTFAADGTLQQNLIAVASENGGVKAGDGEASPSVTGATADYGSGPMTATFTAVPAQGYVFYRWEGASGIVTSGSETSTTITVSANRGAKLRAVFRLPETRGGITSRSYVQSGLVAQYDGIRNAGHDEAHDPNATTWVDLSGNGNHGACMSGLSWVENGWTNDQTANLKPVTVTSTQLSQSISTGRFTIQFACVPSVVNARMCYFGQYNGSLGDVNVEQYTAGKLRLYRNGMTGLSTYDWQSTGVSYMTVGGFSSVSYAVNSTRAALYVSGECQETKTADFISSSTNVTSIIGGERSTSTTRPYAFRGTYNAFRLYNRVLTDLENEYNAAIDGIRFTNGAKMPRRYAMASDGTLMTILSATATGCGKVKVCGGEAAASASVTVNHDGSQFVYFEAVPDEGYVFHGWAGDVDAITEGTALTPRVAVDSTRPVTLQARFGASGNALDGMVLDFDIRDVEEDQYIGGDTFDATSNAGNALKAGSSGSDLSRAYTCWYTSLKNTGYDDHRPMFKLKDVVRPATPTTTNAAQTCIYLQQYVDSATNCASSRWELPYCYVRGPAATLYVRFLWEGRVYMGTDKYNDSCILCNGYSSYSTPGQGFVLRIRAPTNADMGFFNVFTPGAVPVPDLSTEQGLYIEAGRWVDCFVSVYPSPTDPSLSNADVWFCQASPLRTSGGVSYFDKPVLKHKHFGDEAALLKFRTVDEDHAIRLGAETSGVQADIDNIRKTFRGYYAALKGWNRLLTENEMWSVMLGQYGGTFNVGVENGSANEFGSSGRVVETFNTATNKWWEMKKSLTAADRALTLEVPLTAENAGLPRMLEIAPLFDGVGASCPVTVTVNGAVVGTFDLMKEDDRSIPLRRDKVTRNANGSLTIAVVRPEGCAGTLSFDAISLRGSWQVGGDNNTASDIGPEARDTSGVYVMGDPDYKHAQGALTATYSTLSLLFDVPKTCAGTAPYRYQTEIAGLREGGGHPAPAHLDLNGTTIWSCEALALNQVLRIDLAAEALKPGLNELKWHWDAKESANWMSFDYHRLRMVPPQVATLIVVR
ncbi:MAG: hypothetical protein IKE55_03985 [Kiritimatiellae bacterium]|nr:hypothetical protein [Kiritimatiellia bacterium]